MIKHIIWDSNPDFEDWREGLEEEYPNLSEDELRDKMYFLTECYSEDEKINLNIDLPQSIIAIADLGFWYGNRCGYRELGTQMQDVNDFLMKDCPSPVEHFLHKSDCPLVFVVEVTERWSLRGNLYELSIPAAQKLRDNAVKANPLYHYENGAVLTQENKNELSWYEHGQLGNLMQIEYIPDNPFEMKSAKTGLRQRCMNMKEDSFEDYLEKLEQRYEKLHKEWSIKEENILEL